MDPITCFSLIASYFFELNWSDCRDSIDDLFEWRNKGGFLSVEQYKELLWYESQLSSIENAGQYMDSYDEEPVWDVIGRI